MKISIISGSHRDPSQSMKVAKVIEMMLLNGICDEVNIVSLANNPIPLWDSGVWDGEERWQTLLTPYREQLSSSDGFVVISPEWHGQVPAGLKNFFLLFSKNELGHKPALIVTVSSGDGGSYPVAELRMSSYKNNRLCYIPEHVIIRNVEQVLNESVSDNNEESDSYYRERLTWALKILSEYARALNQVRASNVTQTEKFGNGM
ncbi:MAG: NADPH-dependent FMN reductase [Gammaproteobacteria bacterium]